MTRHVTPSLLFVLVLFLSGARLSAQTTTGQISGTVQDATGAALPAVAVTVTNIDTNTPRAVRTGTSGTYVLTLLPPGNYQITFSKSGFETLVEDRIHLGIDQGIAINPKLRIGSAVETVSVQGDAELLNATSASLGTVIGEEEVNDLPLNGRNFTQLLTLVPGATPISTGQGAHLGVDDGSTIAIPGSSFSNPAINGQQNRETLYLLDGVVNTDFRTTTYTVLPIIDGIREFKVQSHEDDPAFGSVLGGVVNLVTKSGTNQFHGSVWEFVRNNIFDARNPFSDINPGTGAPTPPGSFHQNEFGLSFGGPLWVPKLYNGRDKTFFFFAYEGWRYSSPVANYYNVPTAQELTGDFSNSEGNNGVFDPTTTRLNAAGNGYMRTEFPGDIIPANRINPQIQAYIKAYYDAPNVTNPSLPDELLTSSYRNNSNNYQGRIDQKLTKSDTAFFRWSNLFDENQVPVTHKISALTFFNGLNIGAGITHIFTPKIVLNVNGGRASRGFSFTSPSTVGYGPLTDLGFTGLGSYGPLSLNLAGPYGGSGLAGPALRRNSSWSVSEQVSWQVGRHLISFGSTVIDDYRSQSGSSQSLNFDNAQTTNPQNPGSTGNSLASALLGYPNSGGFQLNNLIKYSIPTYAVFAGDQWKVSPKLTLNIGLRYDHLNQPNITHGMNNGFNFDTGNWEIGGGALPAACIVSNKAPCIPGSSTDAATDLAGTTGNDGSVAGNHIIVAASATRAPASVDREFGPRLGFAYAMHPSMVISGGFGVAYDTLNGINQTLSNSIGEWPAKGSATHTYNLIGSNVNGTPLTTVTDAEATIGNPLTTGGPFSDFDYYYSPKLKPLYSEQWNLKMEQALNRKTLLSIGYVGSVTRRLDYGATANQATVPSADDTIESVRARTPYPYMTTFVYDSSIGNANYNSLQVKLQQQMSHSLQYLVSYTWSKSLDDTSGRFGAENGFGGSAVQNYYDPESNKSVSGYDVPHFLSISGIYRLPAGKGEHFFNTGWTSYVLGGWQLNSVSQFQSGTPFTLGVNGDVANICACGGGYGHPNLVPGKVPTVSHPTRFLAYNPAAYSVPINSFGNVGRNSLRGESYRNEDLSLFKIFPLVENVKAEFRAEAFNVLNIINYGLPDANPTDQNAGVISGMAGSPRQLQFALKITF